MAPLNLQIQTNVREDLSSIQNNHSAGRQHKICFAGVSVAVTYTIAPPAFSHVVSSTRKALSGKINWGEETLSTRCLCNIDQSSGQGEEDTSLHTLG